VFRVPQPELELMTFALRLAARFSLRGLLRRDPTWLPSVQGELDALLARIDRIALAATVAHHVPCITAEFLEECIASLRPGYSAWRRLGISREVHRSLVPHARRPPVSATLQRLVRRAKRLVGIRPSHSGSKQLAHGGSVIALAGGDGAGKTTCTRILADWLGDEFQILTAHLGRPPRSGLTLMAGAVLKAARWVRLTPADGVDGFPGWLQCIRDVCTARDRYRLYARVRRFAAAGGIALCERHPFPGNYRLAGPRLEPYAARLQASRLGRALLRSERRYYGDILPPDLAIVLRVDPETAVRRKTDEPAEYVRERNRWMWEQDWSGTGAQVMDAGRPLPEVVADLKALIWAKL
jgi:thymidylate kinase